MVKLFRVAPKKARSVNGVVISPEMEIIVTVKSHTNDSFYNGAIEIKETFMGLYGVDIKKGNYTKSDLFKCFFRDYTYDKSLDEYLYGSFLPDADKSYQVWLISKESDPDRESDTKITVFFESNNKRKTMRLFHPKN